MEVHMDAAISALRVNAHEISKSLDHKDLADALYSEELIDEGMYEVVLDKNTGKTNDYRLRKLIKYARNYIQTDPTYFARFVSAIEEISTAEGQSIAHQLKKSYNEELSKLKQKEEVVTGTGTTITSQVHKYSYFDESDDLRQLEGKNKFFLASKLEGKTFLKQHRHKGCDIIPPPDEEIKQPIRNNGNAFEIFDCHYDKITTILSQNEALQIPFASKLVEVGLISTGERDQFKPCKIKESIVRSKAIMGAVSTMIKRGLQPDDSLSRFVSVICLKEFDPYFKEIISAFMEKGYNPKVFRNRQSPQQGQTHFEIRSGNDDHKVLPSISVVDRELNEYREELEQRYETMLQPKLADKNWKYIDLTSIEESVTAGNKSPGSIDLSRLPQNIQDPPRSLIIGPPGIGKSSLVIEICKRWSKKELLKEYKCVILLQVSNPRINSAESLEQAIRSKKYSDTIESTIGKDCLFIVEGYDELTRDKRKHGFIIELIQKEILSRASLIVTSRPADKDEISDYFKTKAIEIIGYSSSGKDEYIDHKLKEDAESFRHHISKFPIMNEFCSIPFYLAILIHLYDEYKHTCDPNLTENFPNTLTKMYGAVLCQLIFSFAQNHQEFSKIIPRNISLPSGEFQCFPPEIYKSILNLCHVSYKALMNPSKPHELKAMDEFETFDLVKIAHIENINGRSEYLTFLHPSIQEYLVAYYISQLKRESIIEHWLAMKKCKRYNLVLQFLSGLGLHDHDQPESLFAFECSSMNFHNFHNFYTLRELCEANSKQVVAMAFREVEQMNVFRTWPVPTPGDFWCLGRIIALSECKWELGFTIRHLQNHHLQMLHDGLQECDQSKASIVKFTLSLNQFDEEGLAFLFKIHPNYLSETHHINISGNHLTSEAILLLKDHLKHFPKLKVLLIHNNDITNHQPLIEALIDHSHITQVSFSQLKPNECHVLMRSLTNLKMIELWQLSSDSVKATIDSIPRGRSNLDALEFYQSEINKKSVKGLSKTLPESSITKLVMKNCGIRCSVLPEIVNAATRRLAEIAKLAKFTLDISDNIIDLSTHEGKRVLSLRSEWMEILCDHNHGKSITEFHYNQRKPPVYQPVPEQQRYFLRSSKHTNQLSSYKY